MKGKAAGKGSNTYTNGSRNVASAQDKAKPPTPSEIEAKPQPPSEVEAKPEMTGEAKPQTTGEVPTPPPWHASSQPGAAAEGAILAEARAHLMKPTNEEPIAAVLSAMTPAAPLQEAPAALPERPPPAKKRANSSDSSDEGSEEEPEEQRTLRHSRHTRVKASCMDEDE